MTTLIRNDMRLVAKDPNEMAECQKDLRTWISGKVETVNQELKDIQENIAASIDAGLETKSLKRLEGLAKKRIKYYVKIMNAILAGFYIVPNFPMEVFAVRTSQKKPKQEAQTWRTSWTFQQEGQMLPVGEGRYVSNNIKTVKEEDFYYSDAFLPVEFPVALVRPEIIKETGKALEAKIFDQVGIVRDRPNADPMIIGKIRDPRGNGREVSFLIAWWLDTETL